MDVIVSHVPRMVTRVSRTVAVITNELIGRTDDRINFPYTLGHSDPSSSMVMLQDRSQAAKDRISLSWLLLSVFPAAFFIYVVLYA
jgi:hypothetical protein